MSALREATPELLLLSPQEGPAAQLLKQRVTLRYGDRQQQFLTVARLEPASVRVVVLMPNGQTLLTLVYDGEVLEQRTALSGPELPAREMLAMMQFALWPAQSLQRHYEQASGWQLQSADPSRVLLWHRHPIVEVVNAGAVQHIIHLDSGYQLQIETLEKQRL